MNFTPQKLLPVLLTGLSLWSFTPLAGVKTYPNTRQTLQQGIEAMMKQFGIVGLSCSGVFNRR